ncbi:MAG: integrase core domain-containing protein, partial [Chthoniobacteraceae bacterium]
KSFCAPQHRGHSPSISDICAPASEPQQNSVNRRSGGRLHEVLDAHIFHSLSQVRDIIHDCMTAYNEERPDDSLGNLPPRIFSQQQTKNQRPPAPSSTSELSW